MHERDQIIFNLDFNEMARQKKEAEESGLSKGSSDEKRRKAIITPDKYIKKVKSIQDKLVDASIQADGSVLHNHFKSPNGEARKFKNEETFNKWVSKHLRERREYLKTKLTPQ